MVVSSGHVLWLQMTSKQTPGTKQKTQKEGKEAGSYLSHEECARRLCTKTSHTLLTDWRNEIEPVGNIIDRDFTFHRGEEMWSFWSRFRREKFHCVVKEFSWLLLKIIIINICICTFPKEKEGRPAGSRECLADWICRYTELVLV